MANLESEIRKQRAKNRMLKQNGEAQKVYNLIKDSKDNDEPPKGNPTAICSKCGKEFEQNYSSDKNVYSNFKHCPSCRRKISEQKQEKLKKQEREVSTAFLPFAPFDWQQEVLDAFERHRFVVMACGNRSGKDKITIMAGIRYFIECLNENRAIDDPMMVPPVLWWQLAPTEKMAKQNWRELKAYFPKEWIVACSDSNFQMETVGGGIIEVRSGYDPESLTGVGLDLLSCTEAARFKDLKLAWANVEARLNSPGRGRKKDRTADGYGQGKALINSSPIGRNDFYELFVRGQKGHPEYSSLWWSAQYPWTCNPINEKLANTIVHTRDGEITYEESLRRQLGDRTFRSNYLADFLAEDGSVFKNFEENCVINIMSGDNKMSKSEQREFVKNWQEVKPFANYVGGYDPATGSSGDTPAFVIRCKDDGRVVRAYNLYGKNYEEQWEFVCSVCKQYNYAPIHYLRTGHTALDGQFEKRGIVEVGIDEQGQNKAKLVQTLELAIENGDVKVLNDGSEVISNLIYEINDYTEKNGKYSNNKRPHDDFVSAMYAAFSDYSVEAPIIEYCPMMAGVSRLEDFE